MPGSCPGVDKVVATDLALKVIFSEFSLIA